MPTWDYEWDYTKGLLNTDGWTRTQNGTGATTSAIDSGGYMREVSNNNNYNIFTWPITYSKCVAEFDVRYDNNQNVILLHAPGNGTYNLGVRIQFTTSYKGIYLGSTVDTLIYPFDTYPTRVKVKMVINENIGQIYVDDVLILNNIDTTDSALADCTSAYISLRGGGSASRTNRIYGIKMKFGRI